MKFQLIIFFLIPFISLFAQEDKYTQPVNKTIPCKISTTENIEWEGGCKEGYAHGFGKLVTVEGKGKHFHYIHLEKGIAQGYQRVYIIHEKIVEPATITTTKRKKKKRKKKKEKEKQKEGPEGIIDGFNLNDKFHGEWMRYYDNSIYAAENYDGVKNGYGWYKGPDGKQPYKVVYRGHFKDDDYDGLGIFYYPRSKVTKKEFWSRDANGKLQGQRRIELANSKNYKTKAPAKKIQETIIPNVKTEELNYFEKEYQNALTRDSMNDTALIGLGGIAHRKGEYQKAITYYTQALVINKRFGWAYFFRGCTEMKLGNYQKANEDFSKTVKWHPGNIQAFYYRGVTNYMMNFNDKAYDDISWVVYTRPKFGHAHYYLALINQKRLERHISAGQTTANMLSAFGLDDSGIFNPNTNTKTTLAQGMVSALTPAIEKKYDIQYHFQMAIKYLKEAGQTDLLGDIFYEKGILYYDQGNYRAALKEFNQGLTYDADHHTMKTYIIASLLQQRQYQQAFEKADKLVKAESDETGIAHYLRGNAHFFLKQYNAAKSDYEAAIANKPIGAFYNNLGVVKNKLNPSTDVCDEFAKAYKENINLNYHYLYHHCNYRQLTERCQNCDGEGKVTDGTSYWHMGDRVQRKYTCNICNGHGRLYDDHPQKALEILID